MVELTTPVAGGGRGDAADDFDLRRMRVGQEWIARAARLPGRSLHLAVALQLIASAQSSRQVALSNVASQQFGLHRNAKYRALHWLENAGLIRVERKLGRTPVVTLLDAGGDDERQD